MSKLTIAGSLTLQFRVRYAFFFILMLIALGLFCTHTASAAVLDTLHYHGHTYYLISENSWTGAASEALSLGGYLTTINDQGEQDFLWNSWRHSLGTGEGLWIGLFDPHHVPHHSAGVFVWMNGEPVTFSDWATSTHEPNDGMGRYKEDYVAMDSRFFPVGAWNDLPNQGTDRINDRGIVEVNNPGSTGISTPEVSTLVLLGSGLAGLLVHRRRRARAASNGDGAVEVAQESNSTPAA